MVKECSDVATRGRWRATGNTRVWSSSIGHGESSWLIGCPVDQFVPDIAAIRALFLSFRLEIGESAIRGTTGPGAFAFRIFGVWAAKLVHEIRNNTVEVNAVVKTCTQTG